MAVFVSNVGCYSPLKGFKDRETGGLTFRRENADEEMDVACGQCLGCRLDRSLMWAMRITHEASLYENEHGNSWLTLTYRDRSECTPEQLAAGYYLPGDLSLNKRHVQNFFKRLRRQHKQNIRYFYCGEYGDENLRPHYHICLFNCSFTDLQVYKSIEGITSYSSPTLAGLWPFGFSTVGELNFQTAAYTSRYVLKKVTGVKASDHYLRNDEDGVAHFVLPEYVNMSLKPGIGKNWYEKFKGDVFPSDETPVPGKGVIKKVPRYYETILKSEDPDTHELVKEVRQQFIAVHGDDFTPERLMQKYKCQKARQTVRRDL